MIESMADEKAAELRRAIDKSVHDTSDDDLKRAVENSIADAKAKGLRREFESEESEFHPEASSSSDSYRCKSVAVTCNEQGDVYENLEPSSSSDVSYRCESVPEASYEEGEFNQSTHWFSNPHRFILRSFLIMLF